MPGMGLAAAPSDVLDAVESRRQASMERLQLIFGPDGAISDLNQAGDSLLANPHLYLTLNHPCVLHPGNADCSGRAVDDQII